MSAIIRKTLYFIERITMNIKNALLSLGAAVLYLAIYLGCQFVVSFVALLFVRDITEYIVHLSTIAALLTIAAYMLISKLRGKKVTHEIELKKIPLASCILMPIFGAAVNIIMAYVLALIPFPKAWMSEYEATISTIAIPNSVVSVLYTVLFAPLCEEITFRGLVHTRIRKILPTFAAMIISSCIFGLIHGVTIQIIYAALLGLLITWIFEKSGSLLCPLLFHIGFNTCGLIIPLYTGNLPILLCVCTLVSGAALLHIQLTSKQKIEFIGKY